MLHLSPRAARLYLMRLDGVRVSLLLASSPPAPGLTAGSCSCGRGFAFRFLQLHLAATPCGSARVGPITSLGIFHPLDTAHVGRTSRAGHGRGAEIRPNLAGSGWLVEFSLDGEPLRAVGVSTDEEAHDVAQEYVDTGQGDRDTL